MAGRASPGRNGNVGMWGISYGGFTAIQVAKLRPPHLRAIVPMYATDDRYTDDVHYVGGCVTVSELSQYAVSMVGMNALPARPAFRGERLARRVARAARADAGLAVRVAPPAARRPVLAAGLARARLRPRSTPRCSSSPAGWTATWTRRCGCSSAASTRRAGRSSATGSTTSRTTAYPGPNLDWLHELVRFFDHWLKGIDNGVMDEPALTFFRRDFAPPEPFPATWPGRLAERAVVPGAGRDRARACGSAAGELPLAGRLDRGAADRRPGSDRFPHRATTGTRTALSWGAGSPPNGLARDLRLDDALVPTYTSAPLDRSGRDPRLRRRPSCAIEASMPVATVVVRLADVAPDGTAAQVAAGVLNLTHRDSHARPDRRSSRAGSYEVRVPLRAAGYRFAPGHRIRLSVASNYWPVLWPSPFRGELAIHHGRSRLVLPTIPPGDGSLPTPAFKTSPAGLEEIGSGIVRAAGLADPRGRHRRHGDRVDQRRR